MTTRATPTAPVTDAQLVASLIVPKSVLHGVHTVLDPRGDQVHGEPTLDVCAGTFPSEAFRTSRRQVAFVTTAGVGTGIGEEAVSYDTEAHAAQAMTELRSALAHCRVPQWIRASDGTELRYDRIVTERLPAIEIADNVLTRIDLTTRSRSRGAATAIFLRRGRLLASVFFLGPRAGATTLATSFTRLAALVGSRLGAIAIP